MAAPEGAGHAREDPSITRLLRGAAAGAEGRDAMAAVLDIVYERLRRLASQCLSEQRARELDTTGLANEAVVRLLSAGAGAFNDRRHLFATAGRIMRHVLVDHARARRRRKRGGDRRRVPLDAIVLAFEDRSAELGAVSEALERLAAADETLAQLVEMRFFLGLTMDEIAKLLGMPLRTAEREWATARAWLRKELAP